MPQNAPVSASKTFNLFWGEYPTPLHMRSASITPGALPLSPLEKPRSGPWTKSCLKALMYHVLYSIFNAYDPVENFTDEKRAMYHLFFFIKKCQSVKAASCGSSQMLSLLSFHPLPRLHAYPISLPKSVSKMHALKLTKDREMNNNFEPNLLTKYCSLKPCADIAPHP